MQHRCEGLLLQIDIITNESELQLLRDEWNALLQRSTANTVFLTWEWISSWWFSYGRGRQLCVLVGRDRHGFCQGIAPLYIESHRCLGRSLRRLRFIGDGSYDSDYLDFIVDREYEPESLSQLLEKLICLDGWDVAQLNEIPSRSATVALLSERFDNTRFYFARNEVPCPALTLPNRWEDYVRMLRPRFRTAIRAALRNMDQWPGGLETVTCEAQLDEWLEELFALHASRWEIRNQNGVFAKTEKREFYRTLSRALLRRGWLHFTRWRIQDVALAYQFGFVYGGTYFHLQEGFDPASSHVAPGLSLRASVIRDLIAAGVTKYDFLGGTGRHKTDWAATINTSLRFAIAPRTQAGFSYIQFPAILEAAKQRIKPLVPTFFLNARKRLSERPPRLVESDGEKSSPKKIRDRAAHALLKSGTMFIAGRLARTHELTLSPGFMLRRRTGPKFVILSYHRVGTDGVPLYCKMRPEVFDAQMQFISSNFPVVSIDDMLEGLHCSDGTRTGVAVTFDDGYLGTYSEAFPILKKYGIPATVYLAAKCIETGAIEWYDRVFLVLRHYPAEKMDILLDRPRRLELHSPQARIQSAAMLVGYLRRCADWRRREICEFLETQVKIPEAEISGSMMTWDQVREMHASGVSFGSHSMTHRVLSRLPAADLEHELAASKELIERRLAAQVRHFAFPFGKRADYGRTAAELQRFGYRSAVTTEWGANDRMSSPFELRRMLTGGDETIETFAFQLTRLLLLSCPRQQNGASIEVSKVLHSESSHATNVALD